MDPPRILHRHGEAPHHLSHLGRSVRSDVSTTATPPITARSHSRSADECRADEAEHGGVRFGRLGPSHDLENSAARGSGIFRCVPGCDGRGIQVLPDLLAERADLLGGVAHRALAVQRLGHSAIGEQADDLLHGVAQRSEHAGPHGVVVLDPALVVLRAATVSSRPVPQAQVPLA